VLHRDVKPANVRVLDSGEVKILDFGIAHLLDQSTRFTGTGVTLGTVGYLAPEQLEGGDVDRRADVFSFGVLAYELLSYQRPFRGDTLSQISYQLVAKEPLPLRELCPECPPALESIVERCLRKDPDDRYPTLEPVIADLERVVERLQAGDEASTILLPTARRRPEKRRRRVPWLVAGAVAVALALLALWRTGDETPPPSAAEPATEIEVAQSAPPKPAEPPADPPGPGGNPEPGVEDNASEPAATQASPAGPPPAVQETEPEPPIPKKRPEIDGTEVSPEPLPAEPEELPPPTEETDPPPPPPPKPEPAHELRTKEPVHTKADGEPPADEPPASAGLITPGPGVVVPELVDRPQPRYPERAQRRKKEARVVIAVLVGEEGDVVRALVKQATVQGYGFEQAALTAARQARFRPATRGGVPGRMWTEVSFDFRLE
jgi:TonB family protein